MDLDKILDSIEWLGHDTFRISRGDRVIYFDPFKLPAHSPAADIILVTHEHFDHCSVEDIARIKKEDTVIVTDSRSARKLQEKVKVLEPGEETRVRDLSIEAVSSYNIDKTFHPRENKGLGFIVTIEDCRIYHAGDTDFIPEMEDLQVDIALLPVSGTYVMTAEEAARAALQINPGVAVPMHYGDIVGEQSDADKFAGELQDRVRVEILEQKK